MLRLSTVLLCLLLAAASAGRYHAEVGVRLSREAIETIEAEKAEEQRRIQILRVELAYLENPERLMKIAKEKTDLKALTGQQLLSTSDFVSALTSDGIDGEEKSIPITEEILKSIALNQSILVE